MKRPSTGSATPGMSSRKSETTRAVDAGHAGDLRQASEHRARRAVEVHEDVGEAGLGEEGVARGLERAVEGHEGHQLRDAAGHHQRDGDTWPLSRPRSRKQLAVERLHQTISAGFSRFGFATSLATWPSRKETVRSAI